MSRWLVSPGCPPLRVVKVNFCPQVTFGSVWGERMGSRQSGPFRTRQKEVSTVPEVFRDPPQLNKVPMSVALGHANAGHTGTGFRQGPPCRTRLKPPGLWGNRGHQAAGEGWEPHVCRTSTVFPELCWAERDTRKCNCRTHCGQRFLGC